MRYLLLVELVDEVLLSRPREDPLLSWGAPYIPILEGGGKEVAELSLIVEVESLSLPELPLLTLTDGFLIELLEPPLSTNLPYSPNFLGGGIKDLAGEFRRLLAFELRESPPSDFFRCISLSGNLL